jgi:hypothetical protein
MHAQSQRRLILGQFLTTLIEQGFTLGTLRLIFFNIIKEIGNAFSELVQLRVVGNLDGSFQSSL